MLLNELSALMLCGIMAENLWTMLEPPVSSVPAGFATGPQIPCCHLCKESLGPELSLTLQQLRNKYLSACVYTHFQAEIHFLCIQTHMGGWKGLLLSGIQERVSPALD